jgi:hypothetical protein
MKHVLKHIMCQKREFARAGLFEHLKNERLTPRERLAFIPAMAHFIMSFGDLNRFVLRYADPQNELERAVNTHTIEDETHWKWYLDDLTLLGLDGASSKTEVLRQLWNDDSQASRKLSYRLIELCKDTDAAERLALIEVMEETGNVTFSSLAPVARALAVDEGIRLPFCGDHHLTMETGHTIGSDHRLLAEIELDDAARARILGLVDQAFVAFSEFIEELSRHARALQDVRQSGTLRLATG